jgi:tetratricopeptide (TPR) repeat protein
VKTISKPHQIRKRALEFAKKRQWDKAVNEYIHLAEIEANNPNVFNELGDLHLKIGNKGDAFKAFHSALDAYERMGLYNNAVAVCKKIIRLSPSDRVVYGKLARLRNQQGIKKEAATYALSYLEKVAADATVNVEEIRPELVELANELSPFPEVLERTAEYFLAQQLNQDAGEILEKLAQTYASNGMSEETERTAKKMDEIGFIPSAPIVATGSDDTPPTSDELSEAPESDTGTFDIGSPDPIGATSTPGQQATEDPYDFDSLDLGGLPGTQQAPVATQAEGMNQMPDPATHPPPTPSDVAFENDSDQIDMPTSPDTDPPPGGPTVQAPAEEFTPSAPETDSPMEEREFVVAEALPTEGETPAADPSSDADAPAEDRVYEIPSGGSEELPTYEEVVSRPDPLEPPESDGASGEPSTDTPFSSAPDEPSIETPFSSDSAEFSIETPVSPTTPDAASPASSGPTEPLEEGEVWIPKEELPGGVSNRDDGDGGVVKMSDLVDHFSAEVKSDVEADDYRSHYDLGMAYLEMDLITEAIREFQFAANSSMYQAIKQNQPRLAVKQLEKGLALIGDIDRDSIGLQYNLGLAYEMIDNVEKAKQCFEEVYVLDVSFRDIAEKIQQYTS